MESRPSAHFSLLQEVSNRAPLERLQRGNCNAGSVQQAGMSLSNFYDSGYSLREVAALFPTFNELLSIGANKHFFMANQQNKRWDIVELCKLYRIEMRSLISSNCFGLTPGDMVACGFTAGHFKELGIDVTALQKAGADFMFWSQLGCTPSEFAQLGGTIEHVLAMRLNQAQRDVLSSCGWNYIGVQSIPGITPAQAVRIWPQGFSFN